MAVQSFPVNHALSNRVWARGLEAQALAKTSIGGLFGKRSDSIIQVLDDLKARPGSRLTIGLRTLFSGDGVTGNQTLEGNEETFQTHTDDIYIDQQRHAWRGFQRIDEQRVNFNQREEARLALADWWADRMDSVFFNHVCANTVIEGGIDPTYYNGQNTIQSIDSNHQVIAGGQANDQSLTSNDIFTLSLADQAVRTAKLATMPIRTVRYAGHDCYVAVLHPHQVEDLRLSSGDWWTVMTNAMSGGRVDDNPIITGALGMSNGVLFVENTRIPLGVSSVASTTAVANTRRAVLLGAQSAALCFGRNHSFGKYIWNEEVFDYSNELGVGSACTYGLKAFRFNSEYFGNVVMSSYAA